MDPSLRTIIYQLRSEWRLVAPSMRRTTIALLAGVLPWMLIKSGISYSVDSALLRGWFGIRSKLESTYVPRTVSIVRLDKPAYTKVGLGPGELFPRKNLAEGLRKIAAAGPKAIIIDAVASRPGNDKSADEALSKALADSPSVIGRSSELVTDSDVNGVKQTKRILNKSIDIFANNAKMVFQTEVRTVGGVVEEICLSNDREVFSTERIPLIAPLKRFVSPDLTEPGGFDFINYYGPPSTLTSISFAQLIGDNSYVDPAYFKDRVVFIGTHSDSSAGIEVGKDSFRTPVSSHYMYGVEIHATIAANLMDRSWIRRMSPGAEGAILGIAALITTYLVFSLPMLSGFFVAVVAMIGWSGFSYYSFAKMHNFIPAITFCLIISTFVILRWAIAAIAGSKKTKER